MVTEVFNRILVLEQIQSCLKEGIIYPIYKGTGKDPLLVSSYRAITTSSSFSKLFESITLSRLNPLLDDLIALTDSTQKGSLLH